MTIYLDTSALVKLIQDEAETPELRAYLAEHFGYVTSALSEVELMRAAHRKGNAQMLQVRDVLDRLSIIGLGPTVLRSASNLLAGTSLRTLDAIHLAAASAIPDLTCICTYDNRMIDSANALGLHCSSPGSQ